MYLNTLKPAAGSRKTLKELEEVLVQRSVKHVVVVIKVKNHVAVDFIK